MSMITGNYHLQTSDNTLRVSDSEMVTMTSLEELVGKRVVAKVKFTKGEAWSGDGQGPVLLSGENYVFSDYYTILEIQEVKE